MQQYDSNSYFLLTVFQAKIKLKIWMQIFAFRIVAYWLDSCQVILNIFMKSRRTTPSVLVIEFIEIKEYSRVIDG